MAEGSSPPKSREDLIPGLPDDLSLKCLARVSHGLEGKMNCVSKKWRDALQDKRIGNIRAREGLSGSWLFAYTVKLFGRVWQAYDPAADRWHLLPPAPGFNQDFINRGFCCVVLEGRLLILGGDSIPVSMNPSTSDPGKRMLCFDPFFRKWTQLRSMRTSRCHFACAVIDGQLFVAGGGTASAESFNLATNTWRALPDLPNPLSRCKTIAHRGFFEVLGCIPNGSHSHVFLDNNEWKEVPPTDDLPILRAERTTAMDGQLYGILDDQLVVLDERTRQWRILCTLPYSRVPKGLGFAVLDKRFYFFGGYLADRGKVSTVRYSDPSAGTTPMVWHYARPLLGGGGMVIACAGLQQE